MTYSLSKAAFDTHILPTLANVLLLTPCSKGSIKLGEIQPSSMTSKGLMRLGDILERPELPSKFLPEEPMLFGEASRTSNEAKA